MSFERSMDEAYTLGFYPAIKAAGYEPFRIDRKEHVNGISDEILMEDSTLAIFNSRLYSEQ